MSKPQNEIARVKNFVIFHDKGQLHNYIRVRTIDGAWGISYRDDTPMYGMWMQMARDKDYKQGIEIILTTGYILTNMPMDKEFVDDFWLAWDRWNHRRMGIVETPSKEESAAAAEEGLMVEQMRHAVVNNMKVEQ